MSRCAPASDPPIIARGSRHTSTRIFHVSSGSGPPKSGRRPVRSSSATTMSSSASNGVLPCSFAMSPIVAAFERLASRGVNASITSSRSQRARFASTPASGECACSSRRARTAGSLSARMRSGTGSPIVSRHPGRPSSTNPERNDNRILIPCGKVSATTRAPRAAARVPASSCFSCMPPGVTPSTFQLSGRSAAIDIEVMRSTSSSVKPLRQPAMISSSCVPGMAVQRSGQPQELVARRGARRHRVAVAVVVRGRLRGREAHRARVERVVQQALHLNDLLVGGGLADRVGAHHDAPERRVPGEEAGVDRGAARLDPLEVVAERLPVPRQALLQRRERDALDPGHQPRQIVDVLVGGGREREPAVAAEHGGDAVHRRRARRRVPQQLRVVVRVEVDEAGRDHEVGRVDRARRALVDVADLDDPAVADARRRPRRDAPPVPSTTVPPLIFRSSISAPLESGSCSSAGTG